MDCRKFQRNLEDYLEGGLDFSSRFAMERHAQQCIACGKNMADIQRLSQTVRELKKVKAPVNFEEAVINRIGMQKTHARFPWIQRFWIYGIEGLSWRKLAIAASSIALLGWGFYFAMHRTPDEPYSSPALIADEKSPVIENDGVKKVDIETPQPGLASKRKPRPEVIQSLTMPEDTLAVREDIIDPDSEFAEILVRGSDNRPVTWRLPKRIIREQNSPPSEEYFIRNVSH
jgi:hypothetical protein